MTAKRSYNGIFARLKEAGMDEDAKGDMCEQQTGKRSLSLMTDAEVAKVDAHMKTLVPPKKTGRPMAKRADVRFIHVLWRKLGEADVLTDKTRAGLNKFIRSRYGDAWGAETIDVDALTDHGQISTVIETLKDWCERIGVELER